MPTRPSTSRRTRRRTTEICKRRWPSCSRITRLKLANSRCRLPAEGSRANGDREPIGSQEFCYLKENSNEEEVCYRSLGGSDKRPGTRATRSASATHGRVGCKSTLAFKLAWSACFPGKGPD